MANNKNLKKAKAHVKEQKEFDEEVLHIGRVTRVVKGGRRLRFLCTVAIGNRKGQVGMGTGKASEVVVAIKKAVSRAKRNLVQVPLTSQDSIPHTVKIKHKAARMLMMPASPGTGVIAGGSLRKILGLAGVKNVLSKNFGTRNPLVTAQASIKALKSLRPAKSAKVSDQGKKESEPAKAHNPKASQEKAAPSSQPEE